MQCQILCYGKNKKAISICRLPKILPSMLSVNSRLVMTTGFVRRHFNLARPFSIELESHLNFCQYNQGKSTNTVSPGSGFH